MSKKFRLDHKIGFQNMFYTKCINVIIDSIGPSIILRSTLCNLLTLSTGTLANIEDPDEMLHNAAFHQGLHCLL